MAELLILVDLVHRIFELRSIFLAIENVRDDCPRKRVSLRRLQFAPQLPLVSVNQDLHALHVNAILVRNAFEASLELLRESLQFFGGNRANIDWKVVARCPSILSKVDIRAVEQSV